MTERKAYRPRRCRALVPALVRRVLLVGGALGVGVVIATASASDAQAGPLDGLLDPVSETLGEVLGPVTDDVVTPVVDELVTPVTSDVVAPAVSEVVEPLAPVVSDVLEQAAPVVEDVATPVAPVVEEVVAPVAQEAATPVAAVVEEVVAPAVTPAAPVLQETLSPLVDGVVEPTLGALTPIMTVLQPVLAPVGGVLTPVTEVVSDVLAPVAPVADVLVPLAPGPILDVALPLPAPGRSADATSPAAVEALSPMRAPEVAVASAVATTSTAVEPDHDAGDRGAHADPVVSAAGPSDGESPGHGPERAPLSPSSGTVPPGSHAQARTGQSIDAAAVTAASASLPAACWVDADREARAAHTSTFHEVPVSPG